MLVVADDGPANWNDFFVSLNSIELLVSCLTLVSNVDFRGNGGGGEHYNFQRDQINLINDNISG